jgi:hypothetical protein
VSAADVQFLPMINEVRRSVCYHAYGNDAE